MAARRLTLLLLLIAWPALAERPELPAEARTVLGPKVERSTLAEFVRWLPERPISQRLEIVRALALRTDTSAGLLQALSTVLEPPEWSQALDSVPNQEGKVARGTGAAAASSPYAADAAVRILAEGGNAADAAAACLAALWVTDPANTSVAGRCQILIWKEGQAFAIGGATQAPLVLDRTGEGWGLAPIPGNPAAVKRLVREHGRLPLGRVLAPAVELATEGFRVTPHLAQVWKAREKQLAADPTTARLFLPGGRAPAEGEFFKQPILGQAISDLESFYRNERLAQEFQSRGGWVTVPDLASYQTLSPEVLRCSYGDFEVLTPGGNTWGHTLVQMLHILNELDLDKTRDEGQREELVAWTLLAGMADRPQELGTLKPKPLGLPLEVLVAPSLGRERAIQIRSAMNGPEQARANLMKAWVRATGETAGQKDYDTTHLSVVDSEGNAVALTTSIGRHFGARVASESGGYLLAQSYLMAHAPIPGARDQTEMTPTIVLHQGKPFAVLGAAGSERIPQAVLQLIVNLVDRKLSPVEAITRPRVGWKNGQLRAHLGLPTWERLQQQGFPMRWTGWTHSNHLGIVQAVVKNEDGNWTAVADRAYDGGASSY